MTNVFNYKDKTKGELIKELQKLQQEYGLLKTSYEKDITERKLLEDVLRESEGKLKVAQEIGRIGIWEFDIESQKIMWSDQTYKLYDRNPALGPPSYEEEAAYYTPEQVKILRKYAHRAIKEGKNFEYDLEAKLPGGRQVYFSAKMHPVKNAYGQFTKLFGTVQDITERKLAEELLHESEERFRQLYQQAPLGYQSLDAEGCFIEVNRAWLDLMGYSHDKVIGRWFGDFLAPQEVDSFRQRFQCFKATGEVHVDVEMVQCTGSRIIVHIDGKTGLDEHGQFNHTHCILHDITNRKQNEEMIRESNQKVIEAMEFNRKVLNTSSIGILAYKESGQCISANKAVAKATGGTVEQLQAQNFHEISSWKKSGMYKAAIKALDTGDEQLLDVHLVTTFGKNVWLSLNFSSFNSANEKHLLVFTSDITERKKAEEDLQLEKENFRHSLDDSPLGVRIATIEGKTIYANKTLLNFYGYDSLEELQKTPLKNRYTPESYIQAQKRKHKRESSDLSDSEYEVSIIRKDGEIRHLQVFRKEVFWDGVRHFQVICNDITERKHAEEALHESKERYRRLVEGSPEAIAVHSKGRFVFVNPAGAKLIGAGSPQELIGKPILDVVHPDSRSQVIERLRHVAEGKEAPLFKEKFLKFDGSVIDVEVVGIPFPYQGKNATQVVVRDITKQMQAEEEIRRSKKLLEDLHKHLDEIRENERALISREIHDQIGQSLTALKLDLNWMDKYVNTNPEAAVKLQGMIELISKTIKDVQRISSDLRPGILDDLGLAAAIEWYCDEFEKRTGIRYSLTLDDSIFGDSKKNLVFFRVFQEALTNVVRHANASSVTIKLRQSKHGTTMTIQDNGIGMHPGKAESAKSLGLIGMRERVKQFGGKVDISSEKGQGTKLTIFIPEKKTSML